MMREAVTDYLPQSEPLARRSQCEFDFVLLLSLFLSVIEKSGGKE